jgi:Predicted Zn peptidase
MSYINPAIITWARQRNGITIEALASKIKKDTSEVEAWELGTKTPSYSCLEKLAYRHFKVPIAVFFFPDPPDIEDPVKKFRSLPDYELARFSMDTLQKIRLGQAYQESLRELIGSTKLMKQIFRDLRPDGLAPREMALEARKYLGITLEQQFSFKTCEVAFKVWRHAIENSGVFTFKDSFKDRFISGFSLLDERFPVIFVNNSNAFARQIFTLIHELGHILYGVYGVTDVDETYVQFMRSSDRAMEIKCNRFAAEFLVPNETFNNDISLFQDIGPTAISAIAEKYSVSREVILRRLFDCGVINEDYYATKAGEFTKEYLRSKGRSGGGNYYLTKLAYLGEGFTKVAFENYRDGRLSEVQLANHLNVNARSIGKIERYLRQ